MATSTPQRSAGLLLFRTAAGSGDGPGGLEVLIAHPGGPLWAKKDSGAWSLPKGLYAPEETALDAARREFAEEMGSPPPDGTVIDLGEVRLKSGKIVTGFAIEGDLDVDTLVSNTFEMPWPPRSGRMQSFPEIDRALWCDPATARVKLNPAQAEFVDRLEAALG